jgi:hypothetical protein
MTTVLEDFITEEQRSVVLFLSGKKDIHKEMFPVHGGKCLSRKAFHNWVEKRGRRFADDEEVDTEVADTTAKILLCCGFPLTGKAMG